MPASLLERVHNAVVVDDDAQDARAYARVLQDAGFTTDTISQFDASQDADSFLADLVDRYDALLCDHVLRGKSINAKFTGAELVCKANRHPQRPLPAVLISSHIHTDQSSIRDWREGIPQLIDKSAAGEAVLLNALDVTIAELDGTVSPTRRPFKTPIEVIDVSPRGEAPFATVVVVGWQIDTKVKMPLRLILQAIDLKPDELVGRWLEADVNCHAPDPEDLFYRNIELAPALPDGWMAE